MTFELLQEAVSKFTLMVNDTLGREAVKPLTLDAPQPPPDELHFHKLIVWCYCFFYEASFDVLKECKALLKQGLPERTNSFDRGSKLVNNLRTFKVHNLPGKENEAKRKQAESWISDTSSNGRGVAGASQALCQIALEMVNNLIAVWSDATRDTGDARQLVERVLDAIDRVWQPHQLDRIVDEVAKEIGLTGFDGKAFRELHLDEWRRGASCFVDRETATEGLRRLIRSAMLSKFGAGD